MLTRHKDYGKETMNPTPLINPVISNQPKTGQQKIQASAVKQAEVPQEKEKKEEKPVEKPVEQVKEKKMNKTPKKSKIEVEDENGKVTGYVEVDRVSKKRKYVATLKRWTNGASILLLSLALLTHGMHITNTPLIETNLQLYKIIL
jgi:hypothetical protein